MQGGKIFFDQESSDGTLMTFDGSITPRDNDQDIDFLLSNDKWGNVHIAYDMFKKYYDISGGYYYPFTTLRSNDLENLDLGLNIGNLMFEFNPNFENFHDINFTYERKIKDGRKSRLTWTPVTEGALTRNIGPVWQDIDETVDIFSVKGATTVAGFDVKAKQQWEFFEAYAVREEKNLSTNATASEKKRRRQEQEPITKSMTTALSGEKWYNNENSFVSSAYRFAKLNNNEREKIVESNEAGVPTTFSNPKQILPSYAANKLDSHTWVGHYMTKPTQKLKLSGKVKTEYLKKEGYSHYNLDAAPNSAGGSTPNGIMDSQDNNFSNNSVFNVGENLSLDYNISNDMTFFTEAELGQLRNHIREEQKNINNVLNWERETVAKTTKGIGVVGVRYVPTHKFSTTTYVRHRLENNDYDDKADTVLGVNSAFIDSMRLNSDELATKFTLKLTQWFQTGFRYQHTRNLYILRVENQDSALSRMKSHTFTYDILFQPIESVLTNLSFSRQTFSATTPAASKSTVKIPGFNADVNSWILSNSYAPFQELTFSNVFYYSFADNFNDYTSSGLPLAVSNAHYTVDFNANWAPKNKKWSIEPHYTYYNYQGTSVSEFGDYSASAVWFTFKYDWI
ncbi:MAG: hypothetical protein NUV91_04215 [Candidatus Omnitrophica bacterium]|nr:hypothetical protein [Candidatus Omnitrophota bacterium]